MEPEAKQCFAQVFSASHHDVQVKDTGFHVKADTPYLGASPDGIVICTCHTPAVLEVKCPYKYQNGLIGWENDKDFSVNADLTMKEKHKYYFQIQLQMLMCGMNTGYRGLASVI